MQQAFDVKKLDWISVTLRRGFPTCGTRAAILCGLPKNQNRLGFMSNWWIYEIKWMKIPKS